MKTLCELLEVELKLASVKHPQTIGAVERSHAIVKRFLHIYEDIIVKDWHHYVDIAASVYNTTYNSSIGCPPTLLFHGRQPTKPLDLRFNNLTVKKAQPTQDFLQQSQDRMNTLFAGARDNSIVAYNKYRRFYDKKALSKPLALYSYCLLMNPKISSTKDFAAKSVTKWLPLYRVEQVLTNSNYIVRKVNTNDTQLVHRIGLRPIQPKYEFEDLKEIDSKIFKADPITKIISEPQIFDQTLKDLASHHSPIIVGPSNGSSIMQFGVRSRFNAPTHFANNPELQLNINRRENDNNTNLVADGRNSDPILQQSDDEQPILRPLQTQNQENRPGFCHEEYKNTAEQFVVEGNQHFQPTTQSAEFIDTRHYPNYVTRATTQPTSVFSQAVPLDPPNKSKRRRRSLVPPDQDPRVGTNRAYELRREVNVPKRYQASSSNSDRFAN